MNRDETLAALKKADPNGAALAIAQLEPRQATALAVSGAIRINGVAEVFALAKHLAKAKGFVPKNLLGDEGSIAAAILTGIELGLGPMEAMRSIHIIEGRPSMSADLMLARAIRAGIVVTWLKANATEARAKLQRPGFPPYEQSWTQQDAVTAGLWGKNTWAKYPAAMLRARCISAALRAYAPDVLGSGVYTPDEIHDGDVIDAASEIITDPETGEVHEQPPPSALSKCTTLDQTLAWVKVRVRPGWQPDRAAIGKHLAKLMAGAPESELEAAKRMIDDLVQPEPDDAGEIEGDVQASAHD